MTLPLYHDTKDTSTRLIDGLCGLTEREIKTLLEKFSGAPNHAEDHIVRVFQWEFTLAGRVVRFVKTYTKDQRKSTFLLEGEKWVLRFGFGKRWSPARATAPGQDIYIRLVSNDGYAQISAAGLSGDLEAFQTDMMMFRLLEQ